MPAKAILESLKASAAVNKGIHINEFVPGIAPAYKAVGLKTGALARIFEVAAAAAAMPAGSVGAGGDGGQLV